MTPGVAEIVLGGVILTVLAFFIKQSLSIPEIRRRVHMLESDMGKNDGLICNMNALLIRVDERMQSISKSQDELKEKVNTVQRQMDELREDLTYLKGESRGRTEKKNAKS